MKKIKITLITIVVILVGLIASSGFLLRSFVTPDFIVSQIESNLNCRAELKSVSFNLFSVTSSVKLEELKLASRDMEADKGTSLKDRKPLKDSSVSIRLVELKVSLLPLLEKRLELKKFQILEPILNISVLPDGNSLSQLFQTPKMVNGKLNPNYNKKEEPEDKGKEGKEGENKPFSIKEFPFAAKLEEIGIDKGLITIFIQETKQTFKVSDFNLLISYIDINPLDLKNHNSIDVKTSLLFAAVGRDKSNSGELKIKINNKIQPFEIESGRVNPVIGLDIQLLKSSYLEAAILMDVVLNKLGVLSSFGAKFEKLNPKVELEKDVKFKASYSNGALTTKDDIVLSTKDFDYSLKQESWFHFTNNQHLFLSTILLSKEKSAAPLKGVEVFLSSPQVKQTGLKPEELKQKILGSILKGDRFNIEFKSKGSITSPEVELASSFPSLESLLKNSLLDGLKGKVPFKF